jgi:hypothetical protein
MRNASSQRQRTKKNPLKLGSFSETSLRYLRGTLGPTSQIVGRADTWDTSNGGHGGGTYNHWFEITLDVNAWIIITKGPPRPNYIQVSVYDLNVNPIEGRSVFQKDSIPALYGGQIYYPYVGHVMNAQSYLYNNFNPNRLDKGDNRYFLLPPGSYLLCISTTRNERLDYAVGLVIEVDDIGPELLLETGGVDHLIFEPVTNPEEYIFLDVTPNYTGSEDHIHSLSEWRTAWEREHQQDDRFPDVFLPLVTTT